jgi:hypothetical protein
MMPVKKQLSLNKKMYFSDNNFFKVAKMDFQTLNELAESAVIVRCKDLSPREVKSARRELLQK